MCLEPVEDLGGLFRVPGPQGGDLVSNRSSDKRDVGETLEQAWTWVSKASWPKVALGVLAILVGMWQLNESDEKLANHGERLTAVERSLDSIDERLDDFGQRADDIQRRQEDIEKGDKDLNRSIAKAVERGINRGIRKALRQIDAQDGT